MLGRTTKGIDPRKYGLTTKEMLKAPGNMEWNEKLPIRTHLFVNLKALYSNKNE